MPTPTLLLHGDWWPSPTLPQAPALRKLEVDDCPLLDGGDWLPPRLVGYSGLQSLTLSQCELEELPPGPYLRGERAGCAGTRAACMVAG